MSDDGFDPVIQKLLERFRAGQSRPFQLENLAAIRQGFSANAKDRTLAEGVTTQDVEIAGIPVRLYRPAGDGPLPLHLYCHGGAFILGSAMSGESDGFLSRRAKAAGCVVASVEYRLAPEHPFPAGVEDTYAALVRLVERAGEFGLAPQAVTVGGASSGGNFAAVTALMARDRGGPAIALQLLEIAGTDLTKSTHAWRHPQAGHDTTRERDLQLIDLYLPLAQRAHPYASPLFAPDLTGTAPAYFLNAEFDPRRDECEAYAARLADAGVQVVSRTMAGHVHGSSTIPDWPPAVAWRALADRVLATANAAALAGAHLTLAGL
ncbi:MAG TPA: alpha/beta hydrolase [Caulobacteraceae bacterium]|nr:alpha/beta hydrolase [Caulobacteraceae bacterium]